MLLCFGWLNVVIFQKYGYNSRFMSYNITTRSIAAEQHWRTAVILIVLFGVIW